MSCYIVSEVFDVLFQARRLPYVAMASQTHGGSFSKGSWIGEMKQASDKTVIISEILDPRTKNLLSMSRISDYVLSNELVSMALAMVAEDRQINDVLEELFAEEVHSFDKVKGQIILHVFAYIISKVLKGLPSLLISYVM